MDHAAALRRTALRYRDGSRFGRHYVAIKLRTDPVHHDVLALAAADSFGTVLDLGCGRAQLGIALLEAGVCRSVVGLDAAPVALADAAAAGRGLALTLIQAALDPAPVLPAADTVLLIDVLYQLRPAAQDSLLAAAMAAARQRVLVRTLDPARGWRSALAIAAERTGRRVWPNAGARVAPPDLAPLRARLAAGGFAVQVAPCWRGTPLANVLIAATRLPDGPPGPAAPG